MNGQDVHFVMIKIVSATLFYALGASLTLGSAIAAAVAILR